MNTKHLMLLPALLVLACGPLTVYEEQNIKCGGPHVVASLASVTLADDCVNKPSDEPGVAFTKAPGACQTGDSNCATLCRQTSMQLAFGSSATHDVKIDIKEVRLLEPTTRKLLGTLTSREPRRWSGESYQAWDGIILSNQGVKATYKLSAPGYHWASDARYRLQMYIVEVDVLVDGELRTLSVEATREPEVAT